MTAPITWTKLRHPGYDSIDYLTPLPEPFDVDGHGIPATHVLRWYNRAETSWVVSYSTASGEQVGSSQYVYSAGDAEAEASYLLSRAAHAKCQRCGETFREWDARAEVPGPGEANLVIHASCMTDGEQIA